MAYEQRDNSGSLFKNDRKEKETHPDYKGTAMVGGVEMWMSAWLKTASNGSKFMSFSFQPKDQQAAPQAQKQSARQPAPADDFLDDMPF